MEYVAKEIEKINKYVLVVSVDSKKAFHNGNIIGIMLDKLYKMGVLGNRSWSVQFLLPYI